MKIILFLLLTSYIYALPFNIDKTQCNQVLEYKSYTTCYNYKNKIPLYSAYVLEGYKLSKKHLTRKGMIFTPNNSIPKKYRTYPWQYTRKGYDRGHLMSNANANYSKKLQIETFLMSNIVPQNPKLNRTSWRKLERAERTLAKKYKKIYVITGVIPGKRFIEPYKINIPKYMYKVIYIPSKNKILPIIIKNNNKDKFHLIDLKTLENITNQKIYLCN